MIHLLIFLPLAAGFACLCTADPRCQRLLFGRLLVAGRTLRLRWAGRLALAAAMAIAWSAFGLLYGTVEAAGLASVAALLPMACVSRRA